MNRVGLRLIHSVHHLEPKSSYPGTLVPWYPDPDLDPAGRTSSLNYWIRIFYYHWSFILFYTAWWLCFTHRAKMSTNFLHFILLIGVFISLTFSIWPPSLKVPRTEELRFQSILFFFTYWNLNRFISRENKYRIAFTRFDFLCSVRTLMCISAPFFLSKPEIKFIPDNKITSDSVLCVEFPLLHTDVMQMLEGNISVPMRGSLITDVGDAMLGSEIMFGSSS